MQTPHVRTPLPGPRAQALIARDELVTSPSYPRDYGFAMSHGRGCEVWDVDGNRFLDFAAGIAVCSTGHCHPEVVAAVQQAAGRFLHISSDFWHEGQTRLAERVSALAPTREPAMCFFGQSGTEAVEAALKLSRYHTGRSQVLAFFGAFHGRTMGAVSLTASSPKYHKHFRPLVSGITHIPYAYCYRCHYNLSYPACGLACLDYIEDGLFARSMAPEEVAAVFVEPVQGEGGYIVPPPGWLARLRALCDKYGILLVADEVQSGIGRTGKMLAVEHWGVEPDIVCLAKALASGMPLSAMIARQEVMTWPAGAHGSTFGGNPVCCAAAEATLDVVEQEGLLDNAALVGARLMDQLRSLAEESHLIGDVRGLGLMIGIEIVHDKQTKAKAVKERDQIVLECFKRGLILLPCGPNSIRFSPPLIITPAQAGAALGIFVEALSVVENHRAA